jgi:hypothetical protein
MNRDSVDRKGCQTVPFGYRVESIEESDARRRHRSTRLVPDPQQTAMIMEIFERGDQKSSDN